MFKVTNKTRQMIPIVVVEKLSTKQLNLQPKESVLTETLTESIRNLSSKERNILKVEIV